MNGPWQTALTAALSVYLVLMLGAANHWGGWFRGSAQAHLLRLIIQVLVPCLIFRSVIDNPALRTASNLLQAPLFGFLVIGIGFLLLRGFAQLPDAWHGLDSLSARRTFAFSTAILNYGFVPIPLVALLFDDRTLGVLFVHNLGVELAIWTCGIAMLAGHSPRDSWRRAINPPSVMLILAVGGNLVGAGSYLPQVALNAISLLADASIPLALLLAGATVAESLLSHDAIASTHRRKMALWACLWRLVLLPALTVLAASLLPLTDELRRVVLVHAAMPAGAMPIVLARHYEGRAAVAVVVVIATSLVSLATMPLWIGWLMQWWSIAELHSL